MQWSHSLLEFPGRFWFDRPLNTDNFGVTIIFFIFILVTFLLFTIFRLCMKTCWWSYHSPVSSHVNFSVNTAQMLISIILSRLIPKCTGTMTLFYHFCAFVLASLRLMLASLYFFLLPILILSEMLQFMKTVRKAMFVVFTCWKPWDAEN